MSCHCGAPVVSVDCATLFWKGSAPILAHAKERRSGRYYCSLSAFIARLQSAYTDSTRDAFLQSLGNRGTRLGVDERGRLLVSLASEILQDRKHPATGREGSDQRSSNEDGEARATKDILDRARGEQRTRNTILESYGSVIRSRASI